ncbi:hypothetical protein AS850_10545 [Frondihabitans sp. 762G35]|uniref:Rv3654c family TadE-like protein n=1 Tax=Frondihabitans sp. 762G35 TaxID=1446794 RepID=UPI000D206BDA|nr:Rv3654c family TadE-like protein [Frondihabitans sp. 762G35]ARC57514.1 hypothetical protein AS850_10545 [Frondihabitans sp. 762G35]
MSASASGRPAVSRRASAAAALRDERGAASLVAVAVLGAATALAVSAAASAALLTERHRLGATADAAAIGAADAAAGLAVGPPCVVADLVVGANGARLDSCSVEGTTVTIRVSSSRGAVRIGAAATAGQSEEEWRRRSVGSKK